MAKDTTPLEEFRRVTATTMRAISKTDVNVSFVPDGGSLLGQEARITVPARDLPVEDVSRVGGEADSNVLSTPHIIAMDNTEAEINVGENIPLQTNQSGTNLAGLAPLLGGLGG